MGMMDTYSPQRQSTGPYLRPLAQGHGGAYLQGPDFLPPGKRKQVDRA